MFDLILINKKETTIYNCDLNLVQNILTNKYLIKENFNKFSKYLSSLNLEKKIKNNRRKKVIIDFDNKKCSQYLGSDFFDGFYIPTMYFETKKDKINQNYLNCLKKLIMSNLIKKEIHYYYFDEEDGKFIDKILNCSHLSYSNLKKLIKNYRSIEKNPKILINFGFKSEEILSDEINLVKIPLNILNWMYFNRN